MEFFKLFKASTGHQILATIMEKEDTEDDSEPYMLALTGYVNNDIHIKGSISFGADTIERAQELLAETTQEQIDHVAEKYFSLTIEEVLDKHF